MTAREALAQEWRERLDDFAESETTVQEWCDFNGVSTYQYYYWRRRLAPVNSQPQTASPSFLALDLVESAPVPTAPGGLTIRVAGAAIEVSTGFDPAMLRAVVGALATPLC
jgi:hypothetical protein